MKVLITGAAGRIGRALHHRLARDHEVTGLDRLPAPTVDCLGDLGDEALLRRALRGVDAVVHAAALHAPQVGLLPDSEFERINVQATRLLAQVAADSGVGRLVFTSTTALYGDASAPPGRAGWVDETLLPRPRTIYHRSKLAAEALLQDSAHRLGLAVTVLRMSRCFPEPAPLMAAYRLHRGIDARDVADAHALALESGQPGFRILLVSGATPFQPEDCEALLVDAPAVLRLRAPALVQAFAQRGWPLPRCIDRVYSPALAMAQLGWQARHGFEAVLAQADAGAPEVLPAPVETAPCH